MIVAGCSANGRSFAERQTTIPTVIDAPILSLKPVKLGRVRSVECDLLGAEESFARLPRHLT